MTELFQLKDAWERIRCTDALILTHKNPDADAVGSAMALVHLIRESGGRARAVCADPIPQRLFFLTEGEDFVYSSGDEAGKLVIAVDVASPSQLGGLEELSPKVSFAIDHHAVATPFAKVTLCDPDASSAGEVVFRIADLQADEADDCPRLTPQIARYLYAAISSDTGSFKYSCTSSRTHGAAGKLTQIINSAADGGIDTADIARLLFDTHTHAELLGNAVAAQKLTLSDDGKLAVTVITLEDCRLAGISPEDCATAVDIVRSVAGVSAGVCIKEKGSGEYRISARSNCDFDVAKVCASFGGGGHVRAAGATVFADSPEEARAAVMKAFTEALEVRNG